MESKTRAASGCSFTFKSRGDGALTVYLNEYQRLLLDRWELLDRPEIPLSSGITILDLERFLTSDPPPKEEDIKTIEEFLG